MDVRATLRKHGPTLLENAASDLASKAIASFAWAVVPLLIAACVWLVQFPNTDTDEDRLPPTDLSMQVPPNEDPESQPPMPAAAKLLGPPDLVQYCHQMGLVPVLRYSNAWGYRCARTAGLAGNRQGDRYVYVPDACAETFPSAKDVVDHYTDYADPKSWGCYA